LAQAGMIQYLGTEKDVGIDDFVAAIEGIAAGTVDLAGQALRGWLAVDGMGAMRVAECMLPTEPHDLHLRDARAEDAGLFFGWVNDPQVRRQSLNTRPIPWAAHRQWFSAKIADARSRLFVLEAKSLPVGQIRFDREGDEARINYSLDVQFRGRGWGAILVAKGVERMVSTGRIVFRAEVKRSNRASAAVFARLGFLESPAPDRGDLTLFHFDSGRGAPAGTS